MHRVPKHRVIIAPATPLGIAPAKTNKKPTQGQIKGRVVNLSYLLISEMNINMKIMNFFHYFVLFLL